MQRIPKIGNAPEPAAGAYLEEFSNVGSCEAEALVLPACSLEAGARTRLA